MIYWEPKKNPPDPSTVTILSKNARRIMKMFEEKARSQRSNHQSNMMPSLNLRGDEFRKKIVSKSQATTSSYFSPKQSISGSVSDNTLKSSFLPMNIIPVNFMRTIETIDSELVPVPENTTIFEEKEPLDSPAKAPNIKSPQITASYSEITAAEPNLDQVDNDNFLMQNTHETFNSDYMDNIETKIDLYQPQSTDSEIILSSDSDDEKNIPMDTTLEEFEIETEKTLNLIDQPTQMSQLSPTADEFNEMEEYNNYKTRIDELLSDPDIDNSVPSINILRKTNINQNANNKIKRTESVKNKETDNIEIKQRKTLLIDVLRSEFKNEKKKHIEKTPPDADVSKYSNTSIKNNSTEHLISDVLSNKEMQNKRTLPPEGNIKKKKPKFIVPFKSQQSQQDSIEKIPQETPHKETFSNKFQENKNIKILNSSNINLTVNEIKNNKEPIEMCIGIISRNDKFLIDNYDENQTPKGLMILIKDENYSEKFYKLLIDRNKTDLSDERNFIQFLMSINCRRVSFNIQELYVYLIRIIQFSYKEVALHWKIMDVSIGCWLLNPDNDLKDFKSILKLLEMDYENFKDETIIENLKLLSKCAERMYNKLVEKRLWRVYIDLETPIASILAAMTMKGITVKEKQLKYIEIIIDKRLGKLQSEANDIIGSYVQLTSPTELRKILFDQLHLDTEIKNLPSTPGQLKSTSEYALKLLVPYHPLPGIVLEFRHLHKLKTTYINGIIPYIIKNILTTTWDQITAATGRIISRSPNIQAIPKQSTIIKEDDNEIVLEIRKVFESKDEYTLLSADFQQIELRLFAHFSQDKQLKEMIMNANDIFEVLTKQWLNYPPSKEITLDERDRTKRVVYAVMYGAGPGKLEQVLNIDKNEAKNIFSSFTSKFPQIRNFIQQIIQKARKNGYITSLSGRKRFFPHINSSDSNLKSQSERQAVNFLIQGSAADIFKAAMLATEQALQDESYDAELILQLHDELIWELKKEELTKVQDLIKNVMESVKTQCKITLPLPVVIKVGKTWATLDKN